MEQLDDKEPHGAPGSARGSEDSYFLDIIACSCLFIYLLQYGRLKKCCVSFAVPLCSADK